MNNTRANFVKLLESKKSHIEDMERTLTEQKNLLKKSKIVEFCELAENIDCIIEQIKNIDYDIARLESDDLNLSGLVKSGDNEVKRIVTGIIQISKRNHDLISELTDILKKGYHDLKEELGDTIELSKIGGYKTLKNPSPVYFDKTS